MGLLVLLRYVQRWSKDFSRGLATSAEKPSLHITGQMCPCQYVEEILYQKRLTGKSGMIIILLNRKGAVKGMEFGTAHV